jgi:hypothetical protein
VVRRSGVVDPDGTKAVQREGKRCGVCRLGAKDDVCRVGCGCSPQGEEKHKEHPFWVDLSSHGQPENTHRRREATRVIMAT